jgi:iron complex outermembrane recepter protein
MVGVAFAAQSGPGTMPSAFAGDDESGKSSDSAPKLQEVIVTAEKRTEKLQNVAGAVSVLSAGTLAQTGVTQLSDYEKQLPGVNMIGAAGPGEGEVIMRGITSGADRSSPVGIYLDDVPLTASSPLNTIYAFDPGLVDIERIEVLEGPQSTLYGASAEGGLIRFITVQPNLDTLGGSLQLSGSQIDGGTAGYGLRASVNLPLVPDRLALLTTAYDRQDPGFVNNDATGQKNVNVDRVYGGRVSLRVKISSQLETTLLGLIQHVAQNEPDEVLLDPSTLNPSSGSLGYSTLVSQPRTAQYGVIGDTLKWNPTFGDFTNIVSYVSDKNSATYDFTSYGAYVGLPAGDFVGFNETGKLSRFTEEARIASTPGLFEWLLGGYYTDEQDSNPDVMRGLSLSAAELPPTSSFYNVYTADFWSTYIEKAVFADLSYHLTPKIEATIGARYSVDSYSVHWMSTGLLGVNSVPRESTSSNRPTYLATVRYQPNSSTTFYIRAASGYRAGGTNILNTLEIASGAPKSFDSDSLWNYEGGVKGSLFGERVTYTLDGYYIDWKNLQLNEIVQGFYAIVNASSAQSRGAEFAIQAQPWRGVAVTLKEAYTDARFTADAPALDEKDGDSLPYAPKLMSALLVDYLLPTSAEVRPTVGLTYAYHSSQNAAASNGRIFDMPSVETLDLRAGVIWSRYALLFTADNVTDEYGLTNVAYSSGAGATLLGTVIKPRTFGVSLKAEF